MVERADIAQVLAQMRAIQAQMHRPVHEAAPGQIEPGQLASPPGGRAGLRRRCSARRSTRVNAVQQEANVLREGYELGTARSESHAGDDRGGEVERRVRGDDAGAQSSLVDAYKEIMNMPV
jgi:hypothetical protein